MSDDVYEDEKPKKKQINGDELVICNIMKTLDGRTYMWNKLQSTGVFESIFNENPIKNAFASGLRDFGVQLNRELKEYSPTEYIKMIEENL